MNEKRSEVRLVAVDAEQIERIDGAITRYHFAPATDAALRSIVTAYSGGLTPRDLHPLLVDIDKATPLARAEARDGLRSAFFNPSLDTSDATP